MINRPRIFAGTVLKIVGGHGALEVCIIWWPRQMVDDRNDLLARKPSDHSNIYFGLMEWDLD